LAGDGTGTVTFDTAAGDDAVGTNNVAAGEVTLVATPAAGSSFVGWTGDACAGEAATCTFTLDADATITATFEADDGMHTLTVEKAGTGDGTVTFDAADGDDALGTHEIADGTEVTLVATATTGDFAGWTGDQCLAQGATCTFTMDSDVMVTANFNVPGGDTFDLTVAIDGAGTGTVTFDTAGGADATGVNTFDEGTVVTLVATATSGSFAGWTGEKCEGKGITCAFVMDADVNLTATFSDAAPTAGAVAIAAGDDDGLEWVTDANNAGGNPENAAGNTHTSLDYMGLGYTARWEAETAGGFIFRDLGIPAGSIITEAYIQFTSIEATSGSCPTAGCMNAGDSAPANLVVHAVADTAPTAIPNQNDTDPILARPMTTANVEWVVPEWTTKGARGAEQATPDLTALLQEVVDLGTWGPDSDDVMFVIQNNDEDATEGYRQISTFEEGGDSIPTLHFTYTPPAP